MRSRWGIVLMVVALVAFLAAVTVLAGCPADTGDDGGAMVPPPVDDEPPIDEPPVDEPPVDEMDDAEATDDAEMDGEEDMEATDDEAEATDDE